MRARWHRLLSLSFLPALALGLSTALGEPTGAIIGWGSQRVVEQSALEGLVVVAAGGNHCVALRSDNTVVAWGWNGSGESNVPEPNADFMAVAGGLYHSLAVKSGGAIVAWGANDFGQCDVPPPNTGFTKVSAYGHSLGLRSDGTIAAWGLNNLGQCDVPPPNSGFTGVAAGLYHSLGLKGDGTIVAWGNNDYGQCNVPPPNSGFISVAAGLFHSLGLKADGTIVAWGENFSGQCDVPAPNSNFIAVAGGWNHSLGIKSGGTIVAWGENVLGQCDVPAPNVNFVSVAGGDLHSQGIKADGTLVSWGTRVTVPAPNAGFLAVASGSDFGLGLRSDRSVVVWGHHEYGQYNVPEPNTGFIEVAGGYDHSLALRSDGTVAAWGDNGLGQCDVPEPNADFIAIAAGYDHSLALKSTGAVAAWGYNGDGQCSVPPPNADFVAVAAGGASSIASGHSLGIKSGGTIVAWGINDDGQCNVPAPNSGFVAVAAGGAHSAGLKSDGTIVAWGNNDYGQCDVPPPNAEFVAVTCGEYHSAGLKADRTIVTWGRNSSGQCDVPPPNAEFSAVEAGAFHSLGLLGELQFAYDIPVGLAFVPGAEASIPILLQSPMPIRGFSVNICFDPLVFECVDLSIEGTRAEGAVSRQVDCYEACGAAVVVFSIDCPPSIPAGVGAVLKLLATVRPDAPVGPTSLTFVDDAPSLNRVTLCDDAVMQPLLLGGTVDISGEMGVRSDVDASGETNISDPIFSLAYQFAGGPAPVCMDAADDDDSGEVNISDPIYSLAFQFASGPEPPLPYPDCGPDPTDDALACESFPPCGGGPGPLAPSAVEGMSAPGGGARLMLSTSFTPGGGMLAVPIELSVDGPVAGLELQVVTDPSLLRFMALDMAGFRGETFDFFSARETSPGILRIGGVPDLALARLLPAGRHVVGQILYRLEPSADLATGRIELIGGRVVRGDLSAALVRSQTLPLPSGPGATPVADRRPGIYLANPFRPGSEIIVSLARPANVRLTVHSISGRTLRNLLDADLPAGDNVVWWDGRNLEGRDLTSGSYYLRARVGEQEFARKVTLVR